MPKANRPDRPLKVVKSTPKVNKHVKVFDATKFFGTLPDLKAEDLTAIRREMWGGTDEVNEQASTYELTTPRKRTKRAPKRKGYNAKKYTGMITGIADRMVEYLKTVRDDR